MIIDFGNRELREFFAIRSLRRAEPNTPPMRAPHGLTAEAESRDFGRFVQLQIPQRLVAILLPPSITLSSANYGASLFPFRSHLGQDAAKLSDSLNGQV